MLDSLDTLIAFVLIMLVVSLLITILVQIFSAMLNLRGLNLAQGLKRTFAVIDPDGDHHAKELANFILKGRFLSDSFLPNWGIFKLWRHGAAIRSEEIFDAVKRIAIGKEPVNEHEWKNAQRSTTDNEPLTATEPGKERVATNLKESARKLLVALGVEKQILEDAERKIIEAGTSDELRAAAAAAADKIIAAAGTIKPAYKKFESWTRICQERAQQWFTMHTRILSIIFAIIAAFALQLDTVEIFKLVSSNRAVREKLVAQSAAIVSQAEKTLGDSTIVLQSAYDSWLGGVDASVKAAVESTSIKIEPTYSRQKLIEDIETVLTRANVEKTAKDAALKSFDAAVNKSVTDFLKASGDQYARVKADFDDTGFVLFPRDSRFWRGSRWTNGWTWAHIIGVLFSVGLLSLGAPFWYNALRNISSLRSTVAQNISNEQKTGAGAGRRKQL
jgi:hypothetical protein